MENYPVSVGESSQNKTSESVGLIGSNHFGNCRVSRSRGIRDFATIVREGQVIREGCRVLSITPRVGGGAAMKKKIFER